MCYGSMGVSSGKWSFEVEDTNDAAAGSAPFTIGVASVLSKTTANHATNAWNSTYALGYAYDHDGNKNVEGTESAYGASFDTGDLIRVELDLDAGTQTLEFFKNNASQGTINLPAGRTWYPAGHCYTLNDKMTFNFGATGFTDTPTADHLALCTANLPDGTVSSPETGSFTGNANVDGPFVWLGFTPNQGGTSTINSNAITWGTHAIATAGGFKVIDATASYNVGGANTYSIAVDQTFEGLGAAQARAQ